MPSKPQIPLLTIHDCIITTKGNEALVKAIMQQEVERWTGYMLEVESKDLDPIQVAV